MGRDDSTATVSMFPGVRGQALAYLLAALFGAAVGVSGFVPFADQLRRSTSTAGARVGLALREPRPPLSAEDWAKLETDVATLRATYGGEPEAFDLMAALRGLTSRGEVDWAGAERSCRALHWPRCDRPALEELRLRSRP